jgi:uncharacterized coiled-coil DUF342 family protein
MSATERQATLTNTTNMMANPKHERMWELQREIDKAHEERDEIISRLVKNETKLNAMSDELKELEDSE